MNNSRIPHIFLFFISFFAAFTAFSQETTSEIQGIVTDTSGKGLSGATVVAVNEPTAAKYTTTSRTDGHFNLPNLRVGGPYSITISFVGYDDKKFDNVNLLLGQVFVADAALTNQQQTLADVVVGSTRQNKIINNNRTGSQEIISRSQIERLPTINRSLQDFTKLTPSANGLNIGGRNNLYNNVTVDGANFNNAFGLSSVLGGQTSSQPISLDAIEQIQVNISPYDVRQGNFSGTGINTVTRSGTNQFRGTVYTYLKGPGTQGYKVGDATVTKQDFSYNLRGFAIGGPIVKNKVFFFINGESERVTNPATSYKASSSTTPTGGANVSNANSDSLDKLKQFLIDKYDYDPGSYQNYSYDTYSDKITAKIDWNINSTHTLTVKYNYFKSYRDIAASNSGAANGNRQPGTFALPFSGSGYRINNNFNIFIAELNSRFGNTASNKLQIGYTALRDFRATLSGANFPLVDILDGVGNTYTSFGYEPFTYNNLLNTDIYQVSDIFTLYKGAHELTFGTQNYIKNFKNGFAPNYAGYYRFNNLTDFYAAANTGAAVTSAFATRYSLLPDGSFPFAKVGSYELGVFVQDKWRIKNTFTLTYGVRLDAPFFKDAFQSNPYVPQLTFENGAHYDAGQKPSTNLLISPRVGFNWNVAGKQTTQIRGGVGLFAGPPPFVWISNQASNNGVQFGSISATGTQTSPYVQYIFSPDINANKPATVKDNTSYNLVFIDKDFKYPQVLKSSLAIDQKIPGNIILTLEGSFNKDINAVFFQNVNLPLTGKAFVGGDNRIRYDSARIYGGKPTPTVTNPNISDAILMKNTKKGYSYYVSFQAQKTFGALYLNAAYTYSQTKSVNDGGSIAQSNWRDRYVSGNPNAEELSFANFYLPHRIVVSASYKKEYAKYFATSIGLLFEAAPSGAGSFTYNGDVNNDQSLGNNDLIYIPKDRNDIALSLVSTTTNGVKKFDSARGLDQQWTELDAFINQDKYLRNHRGEVVKRNAVVLPWYNRFDLNLTQDFYITQKKSKNRHTLRLSVDLINAGNLLNKDWGTYKVFNTGGTFSSSFLKYEGVGTDGRPLYSFPYLSASSKTVLTSTYKDDTSIQSRWQMQFGLRYLFN